MKKDQKKTEAFKGLCKHIDHFAKTSLQEMREAGVQASQALTRLQKCLDKIPVNREMLILNAITDACREMEACPEDSMQDIFNEAFQAWNTNLHMDHHFNIEVKPPSDVSAFNSGDLADAMMGANRLGSRGKL